MQPQRTCTEDGCDEPHLARGWCKKHYVKWQRSRPERWAKELAADRERRKAPSYRAADRERLRKRRRANGVKPRTTSEEAEAKRRAQRRASRWRRAKQKLEIAMRPGRPRTWISGPCPGCGEQFVARSAVCSKTCRKRVDRWLDREAYGNHRERARRHGVEYQPISVAAVMERDGYRCQLCGNRTKGKWPAPTSPTLDHIIPMALGGGHTWGNVQCACAACNSRKGAAARNEQLRLNIREGGRGKGTVADAA